VKVRTASARAVPADTMAKIREIRMPLTLIGCDFSKTTFVESTAWNCTQSDITNSFQLIKFCAHVSNAFGVSEARLCCCYYFGSSDGVSGPTTVIVMMLDFTHSPPRTPFESTLDRRNSCILYFPGLLRSYRKLIISSKSLDFPDSRLHLSHCLPVCPVLLYGRLLSRNSTSFPSSSRTS